MREGERAGPAEPGGVTAFERSAADLPAFAALLSAAPCFQSLGRQIPQLPRRPTARARPEIRAVVPRRGARPGVANNGPGGGDTRIARMERTGAEGVWPRASKLPDDAGTHKLA
jgi:hypothetical protein